MMMEALVDSDAALKRIKIIGEGEDVGLLHIVFTLGREGVGGSFAQFLAFFGRFGIAVRLLKGDRGSVLQPLIAGDGSGDLGDGVRSVGDAGRWLNSFWSLGLL